MATKSLDQLKGERAMIKGRVTRFKTFWDSFNKTNGNVGILKVKLEHLELQYDAFDLVQTAIESDPENDSPEARAMEEQTRFSFEERYCELVAAAREHIQSKTGPAIRFHSPSTSTSNSLIHSPIATAGDTVYALPKMPLPTFDGSFDNWIRFRDSFQAIVHDREIPNIDKFHFLNQALKGDAARVIQSLTISDANYEIAWKCLVDRYEDKNALIHNHVRALCELKAVSKDSFTELRQFIDDLNSSLRALKALGQPTDHWDTLVVYLMSKKLDSNTKREWDRKQINLTELPNVKDFLNFLETQSKFLHRAHIERHSLPSHSHQVKTNPSNKKSSGNLASHVATDKSACVICTKPHALFECNEFKKLSVEERGNVVRKFHLCFNCLSSGHGNRNCQSGTCRKCSKRHHTLLHRDWREKPEQDQQSSPENVDVKPSLTSHLLSSRESDEYADPYVILSTAIVQIRDRKGNFHECRVLLDTGSQPNLITEELCRKLELPLLPIEMTVSGVEQTGLKLTKRTNVVIKSKFKRYETTLRCLVTSRITQYVPIAPRDIENVEIPRNIILADPIIRNPRIDLLIGAGLFWDLLCVGQIRLRSEGLLLQKTLLGWVLAGNLAPLKCMTATRTTTSHHLISNQQLYNQVERLWEVDQVLVNKGTRDLDRENVCEQHFTTTTKRASNGRFIVDIPFFDTVNDLGDSYEIAKKRLHSMERKLERDPVLKKGYQDFMHEYEVSGDMTELSSERSKSNTPTYYLPHHAVMKPDSTTTKIRVVFDGSSKTSSGLSLNEVQHVGPTIQDDLFSIALRFRKHKIVLSADIAKMYRRIYVNEEQRGLQRILWRTDSSQPVKVYELNTVTYGTASAPYLATRCLRQLGEENKENHPIASKVIISDFYVDDLLTGADTIDEARVLKDELTSILEPAGLVLRKWASNDERVFDTDISLNEERVIQGDKDPKTLGLLWNVNTDQLKYSVKIPEQQVVTKRTILSLISQIFDPLGLVGPATIRARIILQKLWEIKLDWNESLPQRTHNEWIQFRTQLKYLNDISVPRFILCDNPVSIELHGFCDASEKAYGASIYARSINEDQSITVNLVCAKSRVAPIKTISIPHLELCGALLLAQLTQKVISSMDMKFDRMFLWCDSTITLAWIHGPPRKWETFIANRVTKIQDLTGEEVWNHVSSQDNPADIISRGIDPSELNASELWWHGPAWLSQDSSNWPIPPDLDLENAPGKRKCTSNQVTAKKTEPSILERFSSFTTLIRVLSYIYRVRDNLAQPTSEYRGGYLTPRENLSTRNRLMKLVQVESFKDEIFCLQRKREIPNSSRLKLLNLFLDDSGLLRVGGRLSHASISYDQRHPIILPSNHLVTRLIINDEHVRLMHAGCQNVMAALRTRYWPLSCKNAVKKVLRKCVRCFRVKPVGTEYVMGSLPAARVTPSRPFNSSGVDYAGPYYVKDRTRTRTTTKAYLCIFVCFATKAVHLELAVDLTTDAFLSCLQRFISRRGRPQNMYSDNGTNFVGAKNELNDLARLLLDPEHQARTTNFLSREGINWHFIPANAPHFGGLWESAVKSAKHHLKRVIGESKLTFGELYTVLTQVEACLNSRPLTPLSNDPNDLEPLTPAHFLIGDSLVALPQPDLCHLPVQRLNRYQHLQQMIQHFWQRWQKEYLHQLQQRYKWCRTDHNPIKIGSLVLLKEDNLPPLKWQLGRITELHPGKDGVIRVASVRIRDSILDRPVSKLCVLPIEDSVIND